MMYSLNAPTGAWCSPTVYQGRTPRTRSGLNAPTGAWCSLTVKGITVDGEAIESQCTYRCVVLPDDTSPKLLGQSGSLNAPTGAWCSLTRTPGLFEEELRSQCTYRCVVLPDHQPDPRHPDHRSGLNAPTGAWCFLTGWPDGRPRQAVRLNAPTGAWCFLTEGAAQVALCLYGLNAPTGAWCFLTPALGSGGMTPLRGPGAPPAPGAPLRTGQHRAQSST